MAEFLKREGLARILEVVKNTIDIEKRTLEGSIKDTGDTASTNLKEHTDRMDNPHSVTKEQLGYVDKNVMSHVDVGAETDHVKIVLETSDGFGNHAKSTNMIPQVTQEKAGVMNPVDKIKLDKILFDSTYHLDASILPSYVDDVIEGYINDGKFYKTKTDDTYSDEVKGESGKIYVDLTTEDYKVYRYGSDSEQFILISDVPAATLKRIEALEGKTKNLEDNTTIVTKIKGRAEENYRTGEVILSPEDLGITVVNNTEDKDKEVKTAEQLKNARNISLNDAVVSTSTPFDGTSDIEIPVTSIDATKLTGIIREENLPSYVDDVIEGYYAEDDKKFYTDEEHTTAIEGETGKIYVDKSTPDNKVYRFSTDDTGYILISDVPAAVLERIAKLEIKTKNLTEDGGDYVPTSRTVNGHELKEDINITRTDIGLDKVQNYNQAKAITDITRNGTIFVLTHIDGTTAEVDQQDLDTTYESIPVGTDEDTAETESIVGLFKSLNMDYTERPSNTTTVEDTGSATGDTTTDNNTSTGGEVQS